MIKPFFALAVAAFLAADAPKTGTIPDGVKVQFFVAQNQLQEANKKAQALIDADPKLKQAFDDVRNAQQTLTRSIDSANKACGGQVSIIGGDLKCVGTAPTSAAPKKP